MSTRYGWCMSGQCVTSDSATVCPGKARPTWQAQADCTCSCHTKEYTLEELI